MKSKEAVYEVQESVGGAGKDEAARSLQSDVARVAELAEVYESQARTRDGAPKPHHVRLKHLTFPRCHRLHGAPQSREAVSSGNEDEGG